MNVYNKVKAQAEKDFSSFYLVYCRRIRHLVLLACQNIQTPNSQKVLIVSKRVFLNVEINSATLIPNQVSLM